MVSARRDRLPHATVRDLLGITRALYRAELAAPPPRSDRRRLDRLEEIGKHFRLALDLAARSPPDTMGHRAAWDRAEKATRALGEFVAESEALAMAVRATARKMRLGS
jgi:hypothetical protein